MTHFSSFDGAKIAFRTLGEGRPALLLHGFLANAELNFFAPGIAAAIAATGRKVIAPDLRGHGTSAASEDKAAYPVDVLARDQDALLKHLAIGDYDLIGYSLGARTAVRMMARGAKPAKAVLGGMGDAGVLDVNQRVAFFEDALKNGEKAANAAAGRRVHAMLQHTALKATAMLNVLASQKSTTRAELMAIGVPTLVVSGTDDADNGSAEGLAKLLPHAIVRRVPGNHLSAVSAPELQTAIVEFLNGTRA